MKVKSLLAVLPSVWVVCMGGTPFSAGWYHLDSSNYASRNSMDKVGENVFTYTAPLEPGNYEVRLFSKWADDPANLVSALKFTVGKVAQAGTISLDKTAYTAFEPMILTYSDITQNMVNSNAFVVIFPKGAENNGQLAVGGATEVKLGNGTIEMFAPNHNGEFEMRLYTVRGEYSADTFVMSVPFTVSGASNTSGWAQDQNIAEKAVQYGLVPESLKGADWTKHITRAEFAAVAVKLYENLSGKPATPAPASTFTDTSAPDVLKAYNIGAVNGMGDGRFAPNDSLTREQMATMLTRVLKAAYIDGWTLDTDAQFTLNFTMPPTFADDADISDYARTSVYFMVANEIINGMPGNLFAPRAATPAQQAANYAVATREQALAISVRIVENLKDEPLNYTQYTGAP